MAYLTYKRLDFDDLNGWAADDLSAAFSVFSTTCADIVDPDWKHLCHLAQAGPDPRQFFETEFRPVLIEDGAPTLFTGYFEPELLGARQQGGDYQCPIYALPDDLSSRKPYYTRRQIEQDQALAGKGLELAWLADPVDAFFLHVQGSGRIRLSDGDVIRLGFAGKNGRAYTSVGKVLADRGVVAADGISAAVIRDWVWAHPDAGRALLWENQSYVFFRVLNEISPDDGPLGAMNRSITPDRSIAVDPAFTPLGAPVWIEKYGADPINRLMIAQDTGSAINGAQRADIFFGTGDAAGQKAGSIKDGGRMVVLFPKGLV
ncbi:murein transglycosylase A [Yoonia sp.]|uniref:murein transglycosylase A n=1 Tax=Yoonia sp. TaxID=2212373 RepID=UPI001A01BB61|nr:murein transglycosylase A [Yoonia sp.]MBE0413873.1 murein transglycosylase A [Yoonia sp.]